MTYGLTADDWDDWSDAADAADAESDRLAGPGVSAAGLIVLPADAPAQVRRSPVIPVAFAVPVVLSGLAYLGGGLAFLSDAAFVVLTGLCFALAALELAAFGRRQGIGAVLIYGGVLVWFCHDYGVHWFNHDFNQPTPAYGPVTAATIAKVLFYHCLFIDVMVIAFRVPVFRFVDRLVVGVPEPATPGFYLGLVVATLLMGWAAFLATTTPLPVSLFHAAFWFVPGVGPPVFTAGRTGNMNYNWGGYLAQLIQVGQVGGILGAVYALLVARSAVGRVFGLLDWAFWISYSFIGMRRGDIAFMVLPVLGLLFLKYHAQRDPERRARNFRGLIAIGLTVGLVWYCVQKQTSSRNGSDDVKLLDVQGNTMMSEGLAAWLIIPDRVDYPYNTWPGEGFVRPFPDTLWTFVIGPIPRALWHGKPVEQFALWYSAMISKDKRGLTTGGVLGTTVSGGAVGAWYFRYGPAGVVEGAIIYGWMMGVAERALRRAQGQPLKVMFALAFATFLFRSYRDLWWHNLYPLMIGATVLTVVIRLFFSRPGHGQPNEMPA